MHNALGGWESLHTRLHITGCRHFHLQPGQGNRPVPRRGSWSRGTSILDISLCVTRISFVSVLFITHPRSSAWALQWRPGAPLGRRVNGDPGVRRTGEARRPRVTEGDGRAIGSLALSELILAP